jgi:hypothetical protein
MKLVKDSQAIAKTNDLAKRLTIGDDIQIVSHLQHPKCCWNMVQSRMGCQPSLFCKIL